MVAGAGRQEEERRGRGGGRERGNRRNADPGAVRDQFSGPRCSVLRARASNYDFGVIIYVPSGHLAVPSRPSRRVIPRSATSASRGPARYTRPCDYRATNRARARARGHGRYRCRNLRLAASPPGPETLGVPSVLSELRMKRRGGGRRSRRMKEREKKRETEGEREGTSRRGGQSRPRGAGRKVVEG